MHYMLRGITRKKLFIGITTIFMNGLCASQAVIPQLSQKDRVIKFITSDEVTFEASKDLFENAGTINDILRDTSQEETPIHLPEINSQTLARVIEFLKTGTLDKGITHDDAVQLLRASHYLDLRSLHMPSLKLLAKKIPWNLNNLQHVLGSPLLTKSLREEIAKAIARAHKQTNIKGNAYFRSITSEPSWTTNILEEFCKLPQIEQIMKITLVENLIKSSITLPVEMGMPPRGVLDRYPSSSFQRSRHDVVYTIILTPDDDKKIEAIKKLLDHKVYTDLVSRLTQYYKPFRRERTFDIFIEMLSD